MMYEPTRALAKASYDRIMSQPEGEGPRHGGGADREASNTRYLTVIAGVEFIGLIGWFCKWAFGS